MCPANKNKGNLAYFSILVLLIILSAIPLGLYFINYNGGLSSLHVRWGEFGSFIAGIYGSLSFLVISYSLFLTTRQFEKQNDVQVFHKLLEMLQNRITSTNLIINRKSISSYGVFKHLCDCIYNELEIECVGLGRRLLHKKPTDISDNCYMNLFRAINGDGFIDSYEADKADLIEKMISNKDNQAWEELKLYLGSCDNEKTGVADALRTIGSVNFYKVNFTDRRYCYEMVHQRLTEEYGDILDGYIRSLRFILSFTLASIDRDHYLKVLRSQLSRYELIVLFNCLASGDVEEDFKEDVKLSGLLNGLVNLDCRLIMLDLPSEETIRAEIELVLAPEKTHVDGIRICT